jgi:hypothetical protein
MGLMYVLLKLIGVTVLEVRDRAGRARMIFVPIFSFNLEG